MNSSHKKSATPVPMFRIIRDQLLSRISSGAIGIGDSIPTETELMKKFNASRTTVRRAVSSLVHDGLIIRKRGKGSYLKKDIPKTHIRLTGSYSDILGVARSTPVKLLRFEYTEAPPEVCKELHLKETRKVLRIDRLRFTENIPFLYSINYVPDSIGRSFSIEDIEKSSMTEVLARKGGKKLKRFIQNFGATVADEYMASMLELSVGSPVLEIKRIAMSDHGEHVNLLYAYFRGDIYVFTAEFDLDLP